MKGVAIATRIATRLLVSQRRGQTPVNDGRGQFARFDADVGGLVGQGDDGDRNDVRTDAVGHRSCVGDSRASGAVVLVAVGGGQRVAVGGLQDAIARYHGTTAGGHAGGEGGAVGCRLSERQHLRCRFGAGAELDFGGVDRRRGEVQVDVDQLRGDRVAAGQNWNVHVDLSGVTRL